MMRRAWPEPQAFPGTSSLCADPSSRLNRQRSCATAVFAFLRLSLEARVGFEPTNGGFADSLEFSILLVRLAFIFVVVAGFGPYLGVIVPKLFPHFGTNPSNETKN
jgi:hypothetical protein